ncbi:MAG: glycosyltransferase family 4 protein [Thaumarchaeota archaeon]|nr:glycosyltransferase family 4 protein [Nitrososphaerota archaeon]
MITYAYPFPGRGLSAGIERLAEGIANSLQGKGVEVSIVTSRALGQIVEGMTPAGARILPVPSLMTVPHTGSLAINLVSFSTSALINRRREIANSDIVQVFAASLLPLPLYRKGLPPLASYFPHLDLPQSRSDFLWLPEMNMLLKNLYDRSDIILAGVPEGSKGFRDLTGFFEVPRQKIRLVYEGIDPKVFNNGIDASKVKARFGDDMILYVGSPNPRKGIIHLFRAMKKILQARKDAKLVLVGQVGEAHGTQLRNAARSLGIGDHVVFEGFLEESQLPSYYTAADVFAFPSLNDGYPLVCLEAMACGCPIVATRLDTISEIVGDSGILVDPGAEIQISDAIVSLLEDRSLRRSLSDRGAERVNTRFTWDKVTDAYLRTYSEMLDASR